MIIVLLVLGVCCLSVGAAAIVFVRRRYPLMCINWRPFPWPNSSSHTQVHYSRVSKYPTTFHRHFFETVLFQSNPLFSPSLSVHIIYVFCNLYVQAQQQYFCAIFVIFATQLFYQFYRHYNHRKLKVSQLCYVVHLIFVIFTTLALYASCACGDRLLCLLCAGDVVDHILSARIAGAVSGRGQRGAADVPGA